MRLSPERGFDGWSRQQMSRVPRGTEYRTVVQYRYGPVLVLALVVVLVLVPVLITGGDF